MSIADEPLDGSMQMMPKRKSGDGKSPAITWSWLLILLIGTLCLWSVAPQAVCAEVQVLPGASLAIDGHVISEHAAVVAHPTVNEVLAAFGRAEDALQKQDLDALMRFYAKTYNYNGLKLSDVRRVWGEVFTHYRQITSMHHFTALKVVQIGSQPLAELTCTGGLYGTEKASGKRITIDSWFREVHYLVKEDGVWHFLGNAGNVPTEAPAWTAPHHPLF